MMINITPSKLVVMRDIVKKFLPRVSLPKGGAWRKASNNDIWNRVVSQVVVVGGETPAKNLAKRKYKNRISWKRLSKKNKSKVRTIVWKVLRDIGARYTGKDPGTCRKTEAIIKNLEFLKAYPKGPKGFLRHVAKDLKSSEDKVSFVKKLSYIKEKGARDFLTSGFGLVHDRIAIDIRIMNILLHLDPDIPDKVQSDPVQYRQLEKELIVKICRPLKIQLAQLDQIFFHNSKKVVSALKEV